MKTEERIDKEATDFADISGEWLYIKSEDPCSAIKGSYIAGAKAENKRVEFVLRNCASYLEIFKDEWKEGEEMLYCEIMNLIDENSQPEAI